jgi:hypothetical protein
MKRISALLLCLVLSCSPTWGSVSFDGSGYLVADGFKGVFENQLVSVWFRTTAPGQLTMVSFGSMQSSPDAGEMFLIRLEDGVVWFRTYSGRVADWGVGLNDGQWHELVMHVPPDAKLSDVSMSIDGVNWEANGLSNDGPVQTVLDSDVYIGGLYLRPDDTRWVGDLAEVRIGDAYWSLEDPGSGGATDLAMESIIVYIGGEVPLTAVGNLHFIADHPMLTDNEPPVNPNEPNEPVVNAPDPNSGTRIITQTINKSQQDSRKYLLILADPNSVAFIHDKLNERIQAGLLQNLNYYYFNSFKVTWQFYDPNTDG